MTQWHFEEKVFRRWVVLMICTPEEFQAELEAIGFDDEGDPVDHVGASGSVTILTPENNKEGQNCAVIWLREWNVATLVHEIAHLVMFEFQATRVPISLDNTETFAFYLEYWYTTITRAYRRKRKGITPQEARK